MRLGQGVVQGLCNGVPNAIVRYRVGNAQADLIREGGNRAVAVAEEGLRGGGRLVDDGLREAGQIAADGARRTGQVAEETLRNVGHAADEWNQIAQSGTVATAVEARDSYRDVKQEIGEWNLLLRKFTVITGRNLLVWVSVCGVGAVGHIWQKTFCAPDSQSWLCFTASTGSMLLFAWGGAMAGGVLYANYRKLSQMIDKPENLSQTFSPLVRENSAPSEQQPTAPPIRHHGTFVPSAEAHSTTELAERDTRHSVTVEQSSETLREANGMSVEQDLESIFREIEESNQRIHVLRQRARASRTRLSSDQTESFSIQAAPSESGSLAGDKSKKFSDEYETRRQRRNHAMQQARIARRKT